MNTAIDILVALLPFAALFAAFLVFRLEALEASLCAWAVEFLAGVVYYRMPLLRIFEASLWGVLTMWSGFLVLFMGQVFGQAYRSTGLLQMLLESVESIVPRKEGKAIALVAVVGGFIGAFNGFAVYPVVIPGLVELGYSGVQAATSFLVYFSWTLPFNSLFIAPTIANAASHVPIVDIVHVAGPLSIPLLFVCLCGFLKRLGFRFFNWETQFLLWSMWGANALAIVLFTVVWPAYYILMMIAGAAFSLALLYVYGRLVKAEPTSGVALQSLSAAATSEGSVPAAQTYKAYAPLLLGVVIVMATLVPIIAEALEHFRFNVAAWGYSPVSINIATTSGFFIFLTAMACYLFPVKKANPAKDIVAATKRAWRSVAALFVGSGMVYLMVDSGQIVLLGKVLSNMGTLAYASLYPFVAFLGGIAFGQGLPGAFLFSRMQVAVAPELGIALAVLVGIVVVITMGPTNALKPTQIAYCSSLADAKGREGEIFRTCLPWQLLQLFVTVALAVAIVFLWT